MTDLDTTETRALTEAERLSIEAAALAAQRGQIKQRECADGSGVYKLMQGDRP